MVKLTDVTGIGPATLKILAEHKIRTVEALAALSIDDLLKMHGFSDVRARAVKKSAMECLRQVSSPPTTLKKPAATASKVPIKKQAEIKTITPAKIEVKPVVVEAEEKVKGKKKVGKDEKENKKKKKLKEPGNKKKKKNQSKKKKRKGKKEDSKN